MVNKTFFVKGMMMALGLVLISFLATKIIFTKKVSVYNFNQTLPGSESFLSLNKTNDKLEMGGMLLKNKVTRFELNKDNNLDSIKVRMAYKLGQKEIKLGVRDNESNPFTYKSLFFDPLNDLTWDKVTQRGLTLYQKNKQFDTVDAFLQQIPNNKKIGIYQVDPNTLVPYIFSNNQANTKTVIDTPIRGNATMYVLVPGGDLKIAVTKQDINMYDGNDNLNVTLTLGGIKVGEMMMTDDGFADKSRNQTAPQVEDFILTDTKPGIYKIEFRFDSPNNDSVISKIEINQSKIIFGGPILIWEAKSTDFYTPSNKIIASTLWPESIQNLKVDDKAELVIKEIQTKFNFDLTKSINNKPTGELYKITSPKGNINFETNGYFAMNLESYFDPAIIKAQVLSGATSRAEIEKNLDFVLTSLVPNDKSDSWQVSEIEIETKDFDPDSKKLFFSLEVPDLDKQGGSLEIGEFQVSISSK